MSIAAAKAGRSTREIATLDDGLFLIIAEPAAFAEEVLGTLTAAYQLDDAEARALALVTHTDVNFVCADGRLCASSLPPGPRAELASMLEANRSTMGGVDATLRQLGGTSYVGGVFPLRAGRGADLKATLVLLQDWTPTERALDRIRWVLMGVGLLVFAVAIGGALVFSHRMNSCPRMSPRDIAGMTPSYRCRSEPQIAVDVTRTIASRGLSSTGSGTSSTRTSCAACQQSAFMRRPISPGSRACAHRPADP